MKAVVYTRYGAPDVLTLQDVERPAPADDEVLIKVGAASVNPLDYHFMRGVPFPIRLMTGLRKPKAQLGRDVAGRIERVGSNVTQFQPGEAVFGTCHGGAFAEYVCAQASTLLAKPDQLTFEQAAAVPIAAFTAWYGLRETGRIQAGQKVLINGAAGGVGTFAVQIGKALGAAVTGVCSTRNVDMVQSIGADHVVDYTQEDFTTSDQRYDLLLDCVGNHSLSACRRVLNRTGTHLLVGGPPLISIARAIAAPLVSRFVSQRAVAVMPRRFNDALPAICELIRDGKVAPVIDKRYRLSETADAIRYLETGHARGKVVVTME